MAHRAPRARSPQSPWRRAPARAGTRVVLAREVGRPEGAGSDGARSGGTSRGRCPRTGGRGAGRRFWVGRALARTQAKGGHLGGTGSTPAWVALLGVSPRPRNAGLAGEALDRRQGVHRQSHGDDRRGYDRLPGQLPLGSVPTPRMPHLRMGEAAPRPAGMVYCGGGLLYKVVRKQNKENVRDQESQ